MKIPKIIPVWQPVGSSTHYISQQIAEKYGVKTAHTGTLDPMAEGIIIILTGEERLKKFDYAKWTKTYEFEIVFGISTDSYDGLGLVTKVSEKSGKIAENEIKNILKNLEGKYTQTAPPFSAIKIKGKPMHWYARQNRLSEIIFPKRKGDIYNIKLISLLDVPWKKIKESLVDRVKIIKGDLRQEKIIRQWESMESAESYQVAKINVEMSKGLYVRALATQICKSLHREGFVFSIKRSSNGNYNKTNSKSWPL
jgi:tRNA pseudouridine(55) synthase